jgi:hypothetical protein
MYAINRINSSLHTLHYITSTNKYIATSKYSSLHILSIGNITTQGTVYGTQGIIYEGALHHTWQYHVAVSVLQPTEI